MPVWIALAIVYELIFGIFIALFAIGVGVQSTYLHSTGAMAEEAYVQKIKDSFFILSLPIIMAFEPPATFIATGGMILKARTRNLPNAVPNDQATSSQLEVHRH